jgi:hypothetical protein
MHIDLLTVLKVLLQTLTAGFGMFGLLSEYKDKSTNRITRSGKIAFLGILATFIASGAITLVETANSRAAERAHELEVRKLSRPLLLKDSRANVKFTLRDVALGPDMPRLKRLFKRYEAQGVASVRNRKKLPLDWQNRSASIEKRLGKLCTSNPVVRSRST